MNWNTAKIGKETEHMGNKALKQVSKFSLFTSYLLPRFMVNLKEPYTVHRSPHYILEETFQKLPELGVTFQKIQQNPQTIFFTLSLAALAALIIERQRKALTISHRSRP